MVTEQLMEHLGDVSGILFFLLGAMVIVELVDAYDGFQIITGQDQNQKPPETFLANFPYNPTFKSGHCSPFHELHIEGLFA